MKKFLDWPWLNIIKTTAIILGIFIVAAAIFSAGMMTGFRKAQFSFQWGENYHKMFGGPRQGWLPPPPPGMRGDDLTNSHGAVGKVVRIDTSTVLVAGENEMEKAINITSDTIFKKNQKTVGLNDLKVDDRVVILGTPSSTGEIKAKLIRIFGK